MSDASPKADSGDGARRPGRRTAREMAVEVRTGLHEALERATTLVGPRLREETKPLPRRIDRYKEQGNYAQWMDSLFWMGACAEELGLDAELPPEFWQCLESAAVKMEFPQFIPQARGKAAGLPARGLCDYLAAVGVIHREVGAEWPVRCPEQPDLLDNLVGQLAATHDDYGALLTRESASALAIRFKADGWLTDPPPEKFHPVRRGLGNVFLPLFDFINGAWFPASLADERWSVIAFNGFRVKQGGGLFPLTKAKPWWME